MKRTLLILTSVLFSVIIFAQNIPQGINYQAVARDSAGAELANDTLMVQFSVLEGNAISWQETHQVTTNDYGLFTAIIGDGATTNLGSSTIFDDVDWGSALHSLKVGIDYGSGSFIDMGTTDFMSVPYSLHAKTAANGSTTDELQTLSISGDTIFISNGNFIVLPSTNSNTFFDSFTFVPDTNFESYLEANGMGDGIPNNKWVLTANINTVTTLDISGQGIMNFLGIEAFISLTHLECQNNFNFDFMGNFISPTNLLLPYSSALTYLNCESNSITYLEVSNSTALTYLNCQSNQLTSLDVSANTALQYLFCYSTNLTSLDVSNNTALQTLHCYNNQLTSLDVSNSTVLQTLHCYGNQLTSLDVSNSTVLQTLHCYNNQLTSLDVSNSTALTYLPCWGNQLTTLDVSNNPALTYLSCGSNQLTSLDVSNSTALTYLYCNNNQLTILDVSNGTALQTLECNNNQLTSLDLSANTALTTLLCYINQLTILDVRNGNNTSITTFHAFNNSNLLCIDVDNPVYSTANWTSIDPWASFSAYCTGILGCTDSTAFNYDTTANTDDGSCIAVAFGCTDSTALNYNALANTDNGSCTYPILVGDFMEGGVVFWVNPNDSLHGLVCDVQDLGAAEWGCYGVVVGADGTAIGTGYLNTNNMLANNCLPHTAGNLIAANMCNNSTAQTYTDWFLPSKDALNQMYINKASIDATAIANGGDVFALFYYWSSSEYNIGSDYYAWRQNFMDGTQSFYSKWDQEKVRAVRAFGAIYGCTDSTALNYNASANTDDGSCVAIVNGCTDSTSFNYNILANTDNGSCIAVVNGCTDSTALNYNALANTDDGSCAPISIGAYYQGGVIFYLDGNGGGLICDIQDFAVTAEWGCYGTALVVYGQGIGMGAINTSVIVNASCSSNNHAANMCANSTAQGYSDWFLPSSDELHEMYSNKAVIDAEALLNGGLAFTPLKYWSSSESQLYQPAYYAWRRDFSNGFWHNDFKNFGSMVRAIRAF